jgi:hypothetical protein
MEHASESVNEVLLRVSGLSTDLAEEMPKTAQFSELAEVLIMITGKRAVELRGSMARLGELSREFSSQVSTAAGSSVKLRRVLSSAVSKELSEVLSRLSELSAGFSRDLSKASELCGRLSGVESRIGAISGDLHRELSEGIKLASES